MLAGGKKFKRSLFIRKVEVAFHNFFMAEPATIDVLSFYFLLLLFIYYYYLFYILHYFVCKLETASYLR